MRVLAVAYTYYKSDPRVIRACEAVAQQGNEVEIVCLRRGGESNLETVDGVLVKRFPMQRFRGSNEFSYIVSYLAFFLMVFIDLSWNPFHRRWDIIHVHNMPEFLVFATILPKILGTKVILDMHDLMPETFEAKFKRGSLIWRCIILLEKLSVNYADHIITVHEPYMQLLRSRGVPAGKITVVMNLPDHRLFYPRPGDHNEDFVIIYHGIVAHRQGIDLAIRALAILKAQGLVLRLQIIGEGDALLEVKQLVKEFGLEGMVEVIEPFVPATEIPDYLRSAHLGIIPYRQSVATQHMLPVKLLEYVSMDIPVLTTRLQVVEHYFDESMVYYVPFEDVESLAEAVRQIYSSDELRSSLVGNAKRFNQLYNWPNESRKLISVYESLSGCTKLHGKNRSDLAS